ncbi:MAG: thioredoxin [Moraxella sp.]|nr:thioredoxin [Moraxella sp.]
MSNVINVDEANFQSALEGNLPVLVDFWAPWCAPCKAIAPILDDLSVEYAERARIIKVNVDDNPNLAAQFGIRSIPALFVFKNGQKVEAVVGGRPKSELATLIDNHL